MKTWLKGGLIGLVAGIIYYAVSYIFIILNHCDISSDGGRLLCRIVVSFWGTFSYFGRIIAESFVVGVFIETILFCFFALLPFIIIGVIIGLIIQKIKSKNRI